MQYSARVGHLLKETRSICPICFTGIDAKIIEKNNKVYMVKECSKHGKFEALLELDADFYKKTINQDIVKRKKYNNLLIPFTHKCNLNCNFCWLPQRNREDFSMKKLKEIIANSNSEIIRICGGEPTVRKELFDLIRFIKKIKKKSVIVTNGVKLSDLNYVKKLKDAGLDGICISFNSFDDDVYKKLNGKKLLKVKLKALENLKKLNMPTTLSVMVVRGVNDKELKKIFDYCLENNSFIRELRLRGSTLIGKSVYSSSFFVSEMISEFSKILRIDRKKIIDYVEKDKDICCSFGLQLISYKEGNHIHPWILFKRTFFKKRLFLYSKFMKIIIPVLRMISKLEFSTPLKLILNRIMGNIDSNLILMIELRSWPNKYNIDLKELTKCPTAQLSKNGKFSFCYSLILNDENMIEL